VEQYSVDGRGRSGMYVTFALIALALAYGLSRAFDAAHLAVPWWFQAPSFAGLYALAGVAFDRRLWRVRIFGLRFSEIPNFGGSWRGTIRSVNADGSNEQVEIEVTIAQTWSRLRVRGKTERGTTRSKIAGIRVEDEELRYEYEAHVGLEKISHVGFSVLHLIDHNTIDGFYYTLEGFSRKGYVSLQRAGGPARASEAKSAAG
jgi:hypothetical protein